MEIGIDSFAATIPDQRTGLPLPPVDRIANLLAEVETADRAGLDVFGVGRLGRSDAVLSRPGISRRRA